MILCRQKQIDQQFKATLGFIVSLRETWAVKPYLKISKQTNKQKCMKHWNKETENIKIAGESPISE